MAANVCVLSPVRSSCFHRRLPVVRLTSDFETILPNFKPPIKPYALSAGIIGDGLRLPSYATAARRVRRNLTSLTASMLPENPVLNDVCITALAGGFALSLLRFWGEIGNRGIFDQKLTRKLVHVSIGLAFMLFWPLFSSRPQAAVLAALIPGVNIIRMLLIGLGAWKDEAIVKSMSRYGDYRELLKGPLYYACTITLACTVYWRTSPIAIAAICNLCAGDAYFLNPRFQYTDQEMSLKNDIIIGTKEVIKRLHRNLYKQEAAMREMNQFMRGEGFLSDLTKIAMDKCQPCLADIVGRRFGSQKLPYNRNKSVVGSIAMVFAGFIASVIYMQYFSLFGLLSGSWRMVFGFFIVSLVSALVESLPISTELDDNLTVPLTSILVGILIF